MSFTSKHFTMKSLADGVHVAINKVGGGGICNSAVIDLGGDALVFDTFHTLQAAEDLKNYAQNELDLPISYVVNSHRHIDHVIGNQVFDEAIIISTNQTKEGIEKKTFSQIENYQSNIDKIEEQVASTEKQLSEEGDTAKRNELENSISFLKEVLHTLPRFSGVLPNLTFDHRLTIHGKKREIQMFTLGGGHSDSDLILYLPAERILFTADLVTVNTHPYLLDGDYDNWKKILDHLVTLDIEYLIPGHGAVGDKSSLNVIKEYLDFVYNYAVEVKKEGRESTQYEIPESYRDWFGKDFFSLNVNHLLKTI